MELSSEFVKHDSCPNCGSKDNLAVYSDGHTWCFGCHTRTGPVKSIDNFRNKFSEKEKEDKWNALPIDFSYHIPEVGRQWLNKYHLTNKEIIANRFGWSEEGLYFKVKDITVKPLLVLPVVDKYGNLVFWQGRNFGDVGPKYMTRGDKEFLHILGDSDLPIVLVEDLISAIKVSRVARSCPVFGSWLSPDSARRLARYSDRIILWLDYDKKKDAAKMSLMYEYLFPRGIHSIRTEKDPKEYTTDEIYSFLKESIDK